MMRHGRHRSTGKLDDDALPGESLTNVTSRFMGATTNNSRKLANFAGFYKGIQSAGAAIIWRLDGLDAPPPYMNIFASCWALLAGGLIIAAPVLLMKIKDTVSVEEDVKFTDESVDDVVAHKIGHEAVDQEKV